MSDLFTDWAMYRRFTDRARKVMQLANQEAQRFNHEYLGTEHILLGVVQDGSGVAANVLKNLDIDLPRIRLEVEKIVQPGPMLNLSERGKLPLTPRAKKVIEFASEEAENLGQNYVGTENLLLGLIRNEEGVAAQILLSLGLTLPDLREEVLKMGQMSATAVRLSEPENLADLPPRVGKALQALDELLKWLQQIKENGVACMDLDWVAGVREQMDIILKVRQFLLREQHRDQDSPREARP
jgi:ATP-dependent Clp protease ATP-binding subunit ClpA